MAHTSLQRMLAAIVTPLTCCLVVDGSNLVTEVSR